MSDKPSVSIVTILNDIPDLYKLIEYHWNTIDYPKDKLEWIIIDNSKINDSNKIKSISPNILYIHVDSNEYIEKINFENDNEKILWNYHKKLGSLPIGFLRDYAVGCTEHDYILHYDIDTIYNPKTLLRKLRTLKNNKLECIYCKCMLGYDIYEKGLYKLENEHSGYASTLFHTRDFWKRSGFKWTDIDNEAYNFHYNKGLDRNMDNYYDSIKLLSIDNIHKYSPINIKLDNIDTNIPDIVNNIVINKHPLSKLLNDFFYDKCINVLGINSEIIQGFKNDKWNTTNISIEKKSKEKVILKKIKSLEIDTINICFININYPIWKLFNDIKFDCIILESMKNIDQMNSILEKSGYILLNNLFINKRLLQ